MYVWFPPTFRQPFALRFFFLSFSLLLFGERGVDIFSFCAFLPFSSRIKKKSPHGFHLQMKELYTFTYFRFSGPVLFCTQNRVCYRHVPRLLGGKKKQTKQTLIVIISWNGFILSQRLHTVFPPPFVSF